MYALDVVYTVCHVMLCCPMHVYIVSLLGLIGPEDASELQFVMLSFHKPIPGTNIVDYVFIVVPNLEHFIEVRNKN